CDGSIAAAAAIVATATTDDNAATHNHTITAGDITTGVATTTTWRSERRNGTSDCCELTHVDHRRHPCVHWCRRYGVYYLCTYGLYCAPEEPLDVFCAYGLAAGDEVANELDHSFVSHVERSGLLLS
ncbi:PREDICTED: uncharacterized protein LOC106742909, partial [Dinoponera quadriceps]|uniref:Uncharacterized protein LOC106742909 n=1 Tax=Dinoponera quadriceps TaxID=609295 RepID=A0A6P3X063_DINQU